MWKASYVKVEVYTKFGVMGEEKMYAKCSLKYDGIGLYTR